MTDSGPHADTIREALSYGLPTGHPIRDVADAALAALEAAHQQTEAEAAAYFKDAMDGQRSLALTAEKLRQATEAIKRAINRLQGNIERQEIADDLKAALAAGGDGEATISLPEPETRRGVGIIIGHEERPPMVIEGDAGGLASDETKT